MSALLQAPECVNPLCEERGIAAGHFSRPAHGLIFAEAQFLARERMPLDFVTLAGGIHSRGLLEEAGGAAYISELFTYVPTAANAGAYADTVSEKWIARQTITVCSRAIERLNDRTLNAADVIRWVSDEIRGVEGRAAGNASGLPPIERGHEIAARDIVLPDELIEGMLHCGAKMLLGGGSKSFKTWCLADLAISIATGRHWWGRNVKQGAVVYLNLEVQAAFFEKRLQSIAAAKGCTLPASLGVWNLRGYCADHRTLIPKLSERLKREKVDAIVLDPTYKLMSGSENAQEEVAALMDSVEKLALSTGAAVIFGSHFAKGNQAGKEAIDRVSGSGVYARDPDAIVPMTRHEEDGVFVVEPILRNCPPVAPFCVRWEFPLMKAAPGMDVTKLREPRRGKGKSKVPPRAEEVVAVVEASAGDGEIIGAVNADGSLVKLVEKELNVTRAAAQTAIDAAVGNGLERVRRKRADGKGEPRVFYRLDRSKHFAPRTP